ncbi:AP-3 complex subunit delta-1-like, partial [Arapaima gigas]
TFSVMELKVATTVKACKGENKTGSEVPLAAMLPTTAAPPPPPPPP